MKFLARIKIIFFISLLLNLNASGQVAPKIDWKSDIEFLRIELPKKHKDLFFKISKEKFNSSLDELSQQCVTLSDLQNAIRLQQLIVQIGDAHTNIDYSDYLDKQKYLPFSVLWLSDSITINLTTNQNKEILGGKLKKLNGFPIKTIIDSLNTLFVVDNEACKKLNIPRLLQSTQLLAFFCFVTNDEPLIEVELSSGKLFESKLHFEEMNDSTIVELKPDATPYYRSMPKSFFNEKYFEEDSIYFIQYNKCWSRELEESYGDKQKAKDMPSFVEFEQSVFKVLREKPIKKLIFDMRFNSGGSSLQGTDFIKQLAGYEILNKRNKIYVVIGRRTFSSGILNVLDFQRYTKAIIIGEETAGSPNHYGEIKKFILPSSKLEVWYSTKHFQMSSPKLKSIKPDINCEVSFSDFINGVDPSFEFVKKLK